MKKLDPKVKQMSFTEKKKLLEGEMALINKKFKRQVVTFGYDRVQQRIPFNSKKMNEATGGGFPTGKFSILWGSFGTSKTTLCYEVIANAQKEGKVCLFADWERGYDPIWAEKQGVNTKDLMIAPAFESAEEGMDVLISLIKTKAVDLVILDSVQALSPTAEQHSKKGVEKSMEDDTMAAIAKKMSQFFRKSAFGVWDSNCTFVLIAQARIDLGGFIAFEKLSGGFALLQWSALTVHMRRSAKSLWPFIMVEPGSTVMGEDDEIIETVTGGEDHATVKTKKVKKYTGFGIVAHVDKSKVGAQENNEVVLDFVYGKGIEN